VLKFIKTWGLDYQYDNSYDQYMSKIRVAFADTDAMGIVHHSNYLRYFEVARVEWMREKGLDYKTWQAQGLHLPLIESQCVYKKPARFDDILEIKVGIKVKGVRITMDYEVFNTQHVCVDDKMKVLPLPAEVKNLMGVLVG
jgi:YbgC/YbaW family acyl-CoA thioester hydrolase